MRGQRIAVRIIRGPIPKEERLGKDPMINIELLDALTTETKRGSSTGAKTSSGTPVTAVKNAPPPCGQR